MLISEYSKVVLYRIYRRDEVLKIFLVGFKINFLKVFLVYDIKVEK